MTQSIASLLQSFHNHTDPGTFGWSDVRHEINCLGEFKSGELVTLRSRVTAIGTKSLSHATYTTRIGSDKSCARALSKTVRFDSRRMAIDVKPALWEAIEAVGVLRREF